MKKISLNCMQLLRLALILSMLCFLLGCETKAKPIDIGTVAPRPKMGIKLKVVEGEKYMEEPFWDKYERTLLVLSVNPDSPAQTAGIQTGDLLLKIDGKTVHGMQDSVFIMRGKQPGSNVLLDIYRDHKIRQFGIDLKP